MSGGRFNYMDSSLRNEIFGFSDKPLNAFGDREISNLVWDILDLIHVYDYVASGDYGDEHWKKAKSEFKAKYLKGGREDRLRCIVDEAIAELKDELYDTIIIEEARDKRKEGGDG